MLLLQKKYPVNCLVLPHLSQRNLVWLHRDLNGGTGNLYLCSFIVCVCIFFLDYLAHLNFCSLFNYLSGALELQRLVVAEGRCDGAEGRRQDSILSWW